MKWTEKADGEKAEQRGYSQNGRSSAWIWPERRTDCGAGTQEHGGCTANGTDLTRENTTGRGFLVPALRLGNG